MCCMHIVYRTRNFLLQTTVYQFIQRYHSSTTAKWKLWLHSSMIINHNPLTEINTIFDTYTTTLKIKLFTQTYYSEIIHMEFNYFCLFPNCLYWGVWDIPLTREPLESVGRWVNYMQSPDSGICNIWKCKLLADFCPALLADSNRHAKHYKPVDYTIHYFNHVITVKG